ncbi:MAG: N-(5'-phosphoribosyl)anthranilate isomerase, partial [Beijerinckiaceae bacterium]|nr:N-(5'-phosphoribosyl)anthranilate isomerase [Beijerinckiaceae bacterium]
MALLVKICGLSTPASIDTAIEAGADLIAFNFHPRSPRYVSLEQAAALAAHARGRVEILALVVNAGDDALSAIRSA